MGPTGARPVSQQLETSSEDFSGVSQCITVVPSFTEVGHRSERHIPPTPLTLPPRRPRTPAMGCFLFLPGSSACDGGWGWGWGHVIPEQRRSEPQRTPAALGKLAVADVTVTFKRFLNCKLDEKCAGMSLIFTPLTSAGDSRRIVSALSPTAVFILVLLFILRSEAVIHCTFASFCHLLVICFAFQTCRTWLVTFPLST